MPDVVPSGEPRMPAKDGGRSQVPEPDSSVSEYQQIDSIDLRQVLSVLRRNIRWVIVITVLTTAAAAWVAIRERPEFRARAVVRLKNERQAMAGSLTGNAMDEVLGNTSDPLLSQIQVLRSRSVVNEVVNRLGIRMTSLTDGFSIADLKDVAVETTAGPDTINLHFSPQGVDVRTNGSASASPYGAPLYSAGARFTVPKRPTAVSEAVLAIRSAPDVVDEVTRDLIARPIDKTDVVEVTYTAGDPRVAQMVVNAAIEIFQEVSAENALAESKRRRVFIEEQLGRTDSVLAEAQLALSEFREREEVFSSRAEFSAQQTGMLELNVRREQLNADRRMYQALLAKVDDDPSGPGLRTLVSSPGIAQNTVVTTLYAQLQQYRSARDSALAAGRSEANPNVRRLNSLLASTQLQLRDALGSYIMSLEAHIAALDTLRTRDAANIRALPRKEAEEMRLVQRVETTSRVSDQLREEYQRARIAEAVESGQVEIVDQADLPHRPIASGRGLKIILGLVLGLMLGAGAAVLRESLNTKVNRRDQIEPLLGLPVMALIPKIKTNRADNSRLVLGRAVHRGSTSVQRPAVGLITVSHGRSEGAEAYRSLRTNLIFSQASGGLRSLMITSPVAAEGKTTTAANLAVTFAQQGLRVVLVDGDLRKPNLHRVFAISREPGLTDILAGHCQLMDALRPTDVSGLSILSAGTPSPHPAELLGSRQMADLVQHLKASADLVIIDAAPVLVAGDASIMSVMADGTLLIIRAGQTQRVAAQAATSQLRAVGARMLGVVLNDPEAKVPSYEGYSYGYGYYGEDPQEG